MTPMMSDRLQRSVENMGRALRALDRSIRTPVTEPRDLSGIVKDFELLYELTWKTLQKYLEEQGHLSTTAREAFKTGFQRGVLDAEEPWLGMLQDRNLAVHTYNEALARAMVERIRDIYFPAFSALFARMKS